MLIDKPQVTRNLRKRGLTVSVSVSSDHTSDSSNGKNNPPSEYEPEPETGEGDSELDYTVAELIEEAKLAPKKKGKAVHISASKPAPNVVTPTLESLGLIIYVPHGFKRDGYSRIEAPLMTVWDDLLAQIYKMTGCNQVVTKPDYMDWKFEKRGARLLDLNNEKDYEVLKASVTKSIVKGDTNEIVIELSDDYLKMLRATLCGKGSGGQGRKEKLLDLVTDDSDGKSATTRAFTTSFDMGGNRNTEEMAPAVKEKHEILSKRMKSCESCPHLAGSFCKKHPNGAHVRMTAQHVKSWAKCWVLGLQGADEYFPPSTPLFAGFFKATTNGVVDLAVDAATNTTVPVSQIAAMTNPLPVTEVTTISYPTPHLPDTTTALIVLAINQMVQMNSELLLRSTAPTSSPTRSIISDQAPVNLTVLTIQNQNIEYPAFDKFFEDLPLSIKTKHDTGLILGQLTDAKIYHIDELEPMTDAELRGEGLALGDVKWLRGVVMKTIKTLKTKA